MGRAWVVSALKQRYKVDVQLGDMQITLFTEVSATRANLGRRRPMTVHAELENRTPPGRSHRDSEFGPWKSDQPADTRLNGKYTFSSADLSVFHGIRGILSSLGQYDGELDRIEVHGTTDVP